MRILTVTLLGIALFGCAEMPGDITSRQQIEATCRNNIRNGGQQTLDQCMADVQRDLAFIASHPPAAPPSDQALASSAQILSAPYPSLESSEAIHPTAANAVSVILGRQYRSNDLQLDYARQHKDDSNSDCAIAGVPGLRRQSCRTAPIPDLHWKTNSSCVSFRPNRRAKWQTN